MRVLLVEDNPELVKLLVKGLAQGGFSADSVGTVGDARHVLSTMKFTAVVLDLGLPDEDGLALLRDMRRKGDSTRTGRSGQCECRHRFHSVGAGQESVGA